MDISAEMRRCLVDLDVAAVRKLWKQASPHLPQPETDEQALIQLHAARTGSDAIPLRLRAYSYRWLQERGYPTLLPDHLKPAAERIYPRIVEGVGIFVHSKYPVVKKAVTAAMSVAVEDCYANGDTEPELVKARMQEARQRELRGLGLLKKVV